MSQVQKDRSHWVVKKCESFDEMRNYRIQQWQDLPFTDRLNAAWELVQEYWEIKQKNPATARQGTLPKTSQDRKYVRQTERLAAHPYPLRPLRPHLHVSHRCHLHFLDMISVS
jgi:hypothetical protein